MRKLNQLLETTKDAEAEFWVNEVTSIRRWSKPGTETRAPYKPLLLLWLIGRLASGGSETVSFKEAEFDLKLLMFKYRLGRAVRVQYPFVYLASNPKLWRVHDSKGNNIFKMPQNRKQSRPFLVAEAVGSLAPEFELALNKPVVRAAVVNALLHMEFPETLHEELLEEANLGHLVVPKQARRDPHFKHVVVLAYEQRCAFCGFGGTLLNTPVGVEAAHVKMRAHNGPDRIDNGLALCVMHHRLFDRGALGLDDELRILVSQHMMLREHESPVPIKELVGAPMRQPQQGYKTPDPNFIKWHYNNLFITPHRHPT